MLVKIYYFILNNYNNIEFLATGSTEQLDLSGDDVISMEEKFNCVKTMFSNIITLNINKRIKKEDLEKLNKIKLRI